MQRNTKSAYPRYAKQLPGKPMGATPSFALQFLSILTKANLLANALHFTEQSLASAGPRLWNLRLDFRPRAKESLRSLGCASGSIFAKHSPRCAEHLQSIRLVFARLFQGRTEHSLCLRPGVRGGVPSIRSATAPRAWGPVESRGEGVAMQCFAHATQVAGCYVSSTSIAM